MSARAKNHPGRIIRHEKTAAGYGSNVPTPPSAAEQLVTRASTIGKIGVGVGGIMMGINGLYRIIDSFRSDAQRRNLIEDLYKTDPVLSQLDHDQVIEWYAAIVHFAPHFSLDKAAVKEVLENFARFGRVDVNTLKMLAETEKATSNARKDSGSSGWQDTLMNVSKIVGVMS